MRKPERMHTDTHPHIPTHISNALNIKDFNMHNFADVSWFMTTIEYDWAQTRQDIIHPQFLDKKIVMSHVLRIL